MMIKTSDEEPEKKRARNILLRVEALRSAAVIRTKPREPPVSQFFAESNEPLPAFPPQIRASKMGPRYSSEKPERNKSHRGRMRTAQNGRPCNRLSRPTSPGHRKARVQCGRVCAKGRRSRPSRIDHAAYSPLEIEGRGPSMMAMPTKIKNGNEDTRSHFRSLAVPRRTLRPEEAG